MAPGFRFQVFALVLVHVFQVSGFRFHVLVGSSSGSGSSSAFRFQVSGFRFQVSGFRLQVSGFRFLF